MDKFTIRNLKELLSDYVGPKKEVLSSEISRLTAPGENYGSITLKLDLIVKNMVTGRKERRHAIAKILPELNGTQPMSHFDTAFKHENAVYTIMVPTLKAFQKEVGVKELIDWCPDVYGVRMNLNGSDVVDDDACLILENLEISGFKNIDRLIGFDRETTKLILRSLASFHAVPLAMKLRKPKLFQEKIKRFIGRTTPPNYSFERFVRAVLNQNEKFQRKFPNLQIFPERPPAKEPFATLIHCDVWVNNLMPKFVDGKPVANKIVDFQIIEYGSPAADIYFFLFTSVQKTVLEKYLDELLKYYHKHFVQILETHGCDKTPFSYEAFLDEMKEAGKYEFGHTFLVATFVHQTAEFRKQMATSGPPTSEDLYNNLTESGKDLACYFAEVCLERGWY